MAVQSEVPMEKDGVDELCSISVVNGKPRVTIAEKFRTEIRRNWENCLIVKLLGRSIYPKTFRDKISSLWKPEGDFDLIDLGESFFLVKFSLDTDLTYAVEEGPWIIFGRYLTVRRWTPDFRPETATIDSADVWIWFPIEYYHEQVLLALGSAVGKALEVDVGNQLLLFGKFARVCVRIDLTKPRIQKIMVEKFEQRVEYEHLGKICSRCGMIEHRNECPKADEDEQRGDLQIMPWTVATTADGNSDQSFLKRKSDGDAYESARIWGSAGYGECMNKKNSYAKPDGDSNPLVPCTVTKQMLDLFTPAEQVVLLEIEPIMQNIIRIISESGLKVGDRLSAEDQSYIIKNVVNYHPEKAKKIGTGIMYIKVSKNNRIPNTECFSVVSTDCTKRGFSYVKCLSNFVRIKFPSTAKSFNEKYFVKYVLHSPHSITRQVLGAP